MNIKCIVTRISCQIFTALFCLAFVAHLLPSLVFNLPPLLTFFFLIPFSSFLSFFFSAPSPTSIFSLPQLLPIQHTLLIRSHLECLYIGVLLLFSDPYYPFFLSFATTYYPLRYTLASSTPFKHSRRNRFLPRLTSFHSTKACELLIVINVSCLSFRL